MNTTEFLLTKLSEECAEVAQECSKAICFGTQEVSVLEPEGPSNSQKIALELNDLLGVVRLLALNGVLSASWQSEALQRQKIAKLAHWSELSRKYGRLIGEIIQERDGPTGYNYVATYGGGIGPDVWDREIEISAVDIMDATMQAQGAAEESGGWVFCVDQVEPAYHKTRDDLEAHIERLTKQIANTAQ